MCYNFTPVIDRISLNLSSVINLEYTKICHKIQIHETLLIAAILHVCLKSFKIIHSQIVLSINLLQTAKRFL